MARLRTNFQGGKLDIAFNTAAGGSFLMYSSSFGNFPQLISNGVDYYVITLDPNASVGNPEILYITAHPSISLIQPGAPTVTATGSTGSTSYAYRISALNGLGETLASVETPISNGNAVLSNVNYNAVSWTAVPGASSYNVYGRTAGAELKLTNVTATSYNDTGAATPNGALPSVNTAQPNICTVTAARESTGGRTHNVNEPWLHGLTMADVGPFVNDIAWTRLGTQTLADDEFNLGFLDPSWTQVVPSGTQSVIVKGDVCSIKVRGQSGGHCAALIKPIPAGFTYGSKIETAVRSLTTQSYIMRGLIMTDGALPSSNVMWQMPYDYLYQTTLSLRSGQLNNNVTDHGSPGSFHTIGLLYQRLTWVSANTFLAEWSTDGIQWTDFGQNNFGFTMTPTYIGFGTSTWGGGLDSLASYEYFRVTL